MSNSSFTLEVPSFLLPKAAAVSDGASRNAPAEAEAVRAAAGAAREAALKALDELRAVERLVPADLRGHAWFGLLSRYPGAESTAVLERLRHAAGEAAWPLLARHGLLQAGLVALDALPSLKLAPAVKILFCAAVRNLAHPKPQWGDFFALGHIRFEELARVVTLRRFPAGQHDWNVSRLPLSWLARLKPRDVPRVLGEIVALRGRPPMVVTHLNYMRPNPWVILRGESEASYHRIARSIEQHPEIAGILTYSWFYCRSVKEVTPHLGWLRDFFIDNGASAFAMQPAPESAGFTVGSRRRQQLYAEGVFRPRVTMVIWRRREFLDWARAHPELAAQDSRLQLSAADATARDNKDGER